MNLVTFVKGFVDFDDDKLAYLKSQALQQAFTTRESGVTHPFVKSTTYSLKKWPTFVRKVWVDVFDQQPWGNDRIHDPLVIDRCDVINYIPGQYLNWHIDSTSEEQQLESLKIENVENFDHDQGYGSCNKLSSTICLSEPDEYEGGLFEILGTDGTVVHSMKLEKYEYILFPSHVPHRVTEITEGNRWAFVTWAQGPALANNT
jgi:hypothetical protein